jgi:hypothetical protein
MQATATPSPSPSASPAEEFAAYSGYDPDPCYHAKKHDAADLCAQWRASIAAEKAAHEARRSTNWSIVSTFLSALTILGLIFTIFQGRNGLGLARRGNLLAMRENARSTRRALAGAGETAEALRVAALNADAMVELVKATKEASELDLRPYVYAAEVRIAWVDEDLVSSPVQILINNYGRSIALDVQITTKIVVGPYPVPENEFPRELVAAQSWGDVPPGRSIILTHQISPEGWAMRGHIGKGTWAIYCDIQISYCDLWGNELRNEVFCVSTGIGAKVGAFQIQSPPEGYRNP